MNLNKKLLAFALLLFAGSLLAQTTEKRYESLHNNGKIYVTVIVIAIILTGFFIYMFSLDRKISRLEKQMDAKK